MTETNILFLAPHWRVSLIKAFQGARARLKMKGRMIGADSDPEAPASCLMDASFTLPPFSESGCLESIEEICSKESVNMILPLTNKAIDFLDRHCGTFMDKGLLPYLAGSETIEICHDKLKLAEFLKSNDLPAPETVSASSLEKNPFFPMIAKPRTGEGGKNCYRIENREDLEFYSRKCSGHVFQQFVPGREFSIDWFSDQKGVPVLVVPRERLMVQGGEVRVSRIRLDERIIDIAKSAGTKLNLKGPCTLQGILDSSDQFWFTDFNLRFGSGSVHTLDAGGDIPSMIYNELNGGPPESDPVSVQDGSMMTRFLDHFIFPSGGGM